MEKTFKTICKVDKGEGKGIEEYPIYIKAENDRDAEKAAKYYWLVGQGSEKGWGYFGIKTATEI